MNSCDAKLFEFIYAANICGQTITGSLEELGSDAQKNWNLIRGAEDCAEKHFFALPGL
uniref:DUF3800 domain-containing protein n=1 Tax=Steinernema glaseri TaxID=37863 RepID=A0A1I7ZS29_9BILA